MKTFLAALALGTALTTGAIAADVGKERSSLPFDNAPVAREDYNWSRIWGAVIGGYGMLNDERSGVIHDGDGVVKHSWDHDPLGAEGVFGELQLGIDKQFGPGVVGVFGCAGYSDASYEFKGAELNQLESYCAGARVGYAMSSSSMLYVGGGWRWTNFETVTGEGDELVKSEDFRDGPFAEAGLEGRMSKLVGWKAFGRYTFYDDLDVDATPEGWETRSKTKSSELGELQFGLGLTISIGNTPDKLY